MAGWIFTEVTLRWLAIICCHISMFTGCQHVTVFIECSSWSVLLSLQMTVQSPAEKWKHCVLRQKESSTYQFVGIFTIGQGLWNTFRVPACRTSSVVCCRDGRLALVQEKVVFSHHHLAPTASWEREQAQWLWKCFLAHERQHSAQPFTSHAIWICIYIYTLQSGASGRFALCVGEK